jgi:hypothetical protein
MTRIEVFLMGENIQGEKIWEQFGGLMEKINIREEFAKDIADALHKTEKKAHRVVEPHFIEIIMDFQVATRTTRVPGFDTLEPNFRWSKCAI